MIMYHKKLNLLRFCAFLYKYARIRKNRSCKRLIEEMVSISLMVLTAPRYSAAGTKSNVEG